MTTEDKALAIANTLLATDRVTLGQLSHKELMMTLVHVVEQHEAFRQKVSDAVEDYTDHLGVGELHFASKKLGQFIIHEPKPDPLVEVIEAWFNDFRQEVSDAASFRTALEAYGLEIREKNDD